MIICGNIPPFKPLWDRHIKRASKSTFKQSDLNRYELNSTSNYSTYNSAKHQYGTVSAQSTRPQARKTADWRRETQHLGMYGTSSNFQAESMRELV